MDTLGELCRRAIARGRTEEPTEWSTITVEQTDLAAKESEFLGVAIVDGCLRSDIHNGRSTVFRVEAGEHEVSVHIKRRFRVAGFRGRARVSLPVVVEPGERVELVFGVSKDSTSARWALLWSVFLIEVGLCLALGFGWLAFPVLRDAIGWTTRTLGIRQPWLSWPYFFVSSRTMTAVSSMFAWLLVARVLFGEKFPFRVLELGSPYYLGPKSGFGAPPPPFKKPYVDPFE